MQSSDVDNGIIYIKEDSTRRHSSDSGISCSSGSDVDKALSTSKKAMPVAILAILASVAAAVAM